MAWIYLAESAVSPKPSKDTLSPLPIVKTTDIAKPCSCPEWPTEHSPMHPFGTMFAPCAETCFHQSTSSTGGSPAKTFPLQDAGKAWTESEADYFSRSQGLSAKYDPLSCSWRTSQRLLFEDQNELLANFAAAGMTVGGAFYPLRTWARITDERDGGYWRTPDTGAGGTSGLLKVGKTHRKSGAAITVRLVDQVNNPRMWPTPNVAGGGSPPSILKRKGNHFIRPSGKKAHLGLDQAAKMWPTPRAQSARGSGPSREGHKADLQTKVGGQLNPTWVEWLMGYPSEWTALEAWATPWCRLKHAKRSKD